MFSDREKHILVLALDMSLSEGGWMWEDVSNKELKNLYKKLDPEGNLSTELQFL